MSDTRLSMRLKFNCLLSHRGLKKNSALLSPTKYLNLLEQVKNAKTAKKKVPYDYTLLKRHDVFVVDGQEHLIAPIKDSTKDVLFYISSDRLFDVLYDIHMSIGHRGRDAMVKIINTKYKNITHLDIMLFLSLCEVCQQRRRKTGMINLVNNNVLLYLSKTRIIRHFKNKTEKQYNVFVQIEI